MTEREKDLLYAYLLNYYDYLEGELKDCRLRLFSARRIDELDLLEYMIAVIRLRVFAEFSKDIRTYLKL